MDATPRVTLTLLSCSPNFPRASITRYTHAKHEPSIKSLRKINKHNNKTKKPRQPDDQHQELLTTDGELKLIELNISDL